MNDPLQVLQRIRRPPPRSETRQGEACDLCSEPIADEHDHVVDVHARSLLCSCRGCYLLFMSTGAGGGHYRAVPERYLSLPPGVMSRDLWDSLQIPVGIAFFFLNSSLGRVAAFYPGPAGATESTLALDTWDGLVNAEPMLATMEADVEALLVRAGREGAVPDFAVPEGPVPDCFVVPIDACYELVGQMRMLWKGFDGGNEAHEAIDSFFEAVAAKAGVESGAGV